MTEHEEAGATGHGEPGRFDLRSVDLAADRAYIDSQVHTFDSYLKLIEDRFLGGERLDPETLSRPDARPTVREEVRILGDLRRVFDFSQEPRPPTILDPHPFG